MSHSGNEDALRATEISETRQVDPPITAASLPPKQRIAQNGGAGRLDCYLEASTETWILRFVVFRRVFNFRFGLA